MAAVSLTWGPLVCPCGWEPRLADGVPRTMSALCAPVNWGGSQLWELASCWYGIAVPASNMAWWDLIQDPTVMPSAMPMWVVAWQEAWLCRSCTRFHCSLTCMRIGALCVLVWPSKYNSYHPVKMLGVSSKKLPILIEMSIISLPISQTMEKQVSIDDYVSKPGLDSDKWPGYLILHKNQTNSFLLSGIVTSEAKQCHFLSSTCHWKQENLCL